MRTKFKGKLSLLFLALAMLLAVPATMVFADTLNDNLGSNNSSVSLGTIKPGETGSGSVSLTVECTGQGHGAGSLRFSVAKDGTNASEVSVIPSVTLPTDWPIDGKGCGNPKPTKTGTASITVSVPQDAAAGDRSVKVTVKSDDPDVTNTVNFQVNYSVPANGTPADTTAPGAPTVGLDAASDFGSSNSDGITNDNTPTFNGTAEANSTVEVFDGTTSLGTALADAQGNWTFTVDNPGALTDGVHSSITAKAKDAAGNTSVASSALSVTIDTVAPQVTPGDITNTTWRNAALAQAFEAADSGSGLANAADANFTLTASAESTKGSAPNIVPTSDSKTVSDVAGNSTTRSLSALIDLTKPDIQDNGPTPATPNGSNGWYTSAVSNKFSASDALSGLPAGFINPFSKSSGTNEEGKAVKINSGSVSDKAGNAAAAIDSATTFKIDLNDPTNVQFVGGPAADSSYDFGDVPAAPTCTADDAVSGFASCAVTGHSTAVGTHTMTATATDNAGRTATATRTYTVKPWTLKGFYAPVDMGNGVINTAKNGSTVPLKFEVFKGTTELTDTAVVKTFTQKTDCISGTTEDAIENYATGGTSLRYDATSGQFIFNWQTPKSPGACYKVTMTTQDGSQIAANFKLK